MSTAKPRFISKRVKIQNGWFWRGVPEEENKHTHFGFSQDWECQTMYMQSWFIITIPPKPSCLPWCFLPPSRYLCCSWGEVRWGEGAAVHCAMHTRGCAAALSHQVWPVSAVLVAIHAFLFYYFFLAGHWLWTPHYFSTSILLTNDCSI